MLENKKSVLVTGASGFIGQQLVKELAADYRLHLVGRSLNAYQQSDDLQLFNLDDLTNLSFDWQPALQGCQTVIHCAARAHILSERENDPISLFRKINVDATLNLARQAALHGVERFIFISTIGVNGKSTALGQCFYSDDEPNPHDAYSQSKLEAERGLVALSQTTNIKVVIIRPPLVYGAIDKGNFARLLYWVDKSIPLPFGAINNQRSMVSVYNLVQFIHLCIEHPNAENQIFLISDAEIFSTADLLKKIAKLANKKSIIFPLPEKLIKWLCYGVNKPELYRRLCASLVVDCKKTEQLLDWQPRVSAEQALEWTIKDFTGKKHEIL